MAKDQSEQALPHGAQTRPVPDNLPDNVSKETLHNFPLSMVLADPNIEGCPLVYVNRAFVRTTGYAPDAAIGRNCRFLQGPDTSQEDRDAIREGLREEREFTVDILNYRADGSAFVNRLMIAPLHDDVTGKLNYFLGVQTERTDYTSYAERAHLLDERLAELQHRVKNHLTMILTMIRLEMRSRTPEKVIDILSRRVEALGLLYHEFSGTPSSRADGLIDLGAYAARVGSAIHGLDGKPEVILNNQTDHVPAAIDLAAPVGMLISEILTNAFQHAFEGREQGRVTLGLSAEDGICTLSITDDGTGFPAGAWPREDSLGGRIVLRLVEQVEAVLTVDSGDAGTVVTIRFAHDKRRAVALDRPTP